MKLFKHLSYTLLVIICGAHGYCQTAKEVAISNAYRTVPDGKVWVLSNQQDHKVLFQKGAFKSGTSCYAAIYSNPGYLFGISYYDVVENDNSRPKTVGFTFKHLEETFGSDVHLIQPYFILKHGMNGDDVSNSLSWNYEPMEMVFYPGTVVFTSSCIAEMILFEREMTEVDKVKYQQRVAKMEEAQSTKKQQTLQHEREKEEQRAGADQEKFNNLNAVYDLVEVENLQELKVDTSKQYEIMQTLIDLIKSQDLNGFKNYSDFKEIKVSVLWDSSGNVSNIDMFHEESNWGVKKVNSLMVSEEKVDYLKQLLRLNALPKIRFGDQTRTCVVKSELFTIIYFTHGGGGSFTFKRQKNGYKIYGVRPETIRPTVDSVLRENYLSYPDRQKLHMYLFQPVFRFVAEPYLFASVRNEFETSDWAIFPSGL